MKDLNLFLSFGIAFVKEIFLILLTTSVIVDIWIIEAVMLLSLTYITFSILMWLNV